MLAAGSLNAAEDKQQLLDAMPALWANAATDGDVTRLLSLYSSDAFIHVVFTSDELRGNEQISDYYSKYSVNPPKVAITRPAGPGGCKNVSFRIPHNRCCPCEPDTGPKVKLCTHD